MGKGVNKTGRSKAESRHVRLHHWLMNTAAWQHLGALERATYVEIASRYNGSNNGQIGYSIRDIAEVFGVGKSTAARAFKLLEDTGFIVCASKGGFNRKIRHSTEWRLTEFDCNVTGEIASKAFARWSPSVPVEGQQKQITVPPQVRMVPTKGPIGIYSGTIEGEKPSIGTHSRSVSPDLAPLTVPEVGHIYSTRETAVEGSQPKPSSFPPQPASPNAKPSSTSHLLQTNLMRRQARLAQGRLP